MTRQRVGQGAAVRVVHAHRDRREALARGIGEDPPGERERRTRLESGLQIGTQRVPRERRMGERVMPMAGDVSEHDRDLPRLGDEQVVEVAARRGALRGPVGDGDRQAAQEGGYLGHERGLHRAHVAQERRALTLEPASAHRGQASADAKPAGQQEQRDDDRLAPVRNRYRQGYASAEALQGIARSVRRSARTRHRCGRGRAVRAEGGRRGARGQSSAREPADGKRELRLAFTARPARRLRAELEA